MKHTITFAAVASADMPTLLVIGRQSSGSLTSLRKLSSVYSGGTIWVVHAPSRANETRTTIACGRTRNVTTTSAAMGAIARAAGERTATRVALPFPASAYRRRRSSPLSATSAPTAASASTVVST